MRMGGHQRRAAGTPRWRIATYARPGVAMAGYGDEANEYGDIALVPHPTLTVLFDLGEKPFVVEDAGGARQRERVVAGLAPVRARGRGLAGRSECLQLRLSPLLGYPLLGATADLRGAVVALDDLWGRDAVRIQERLRAARSWPDRFAIVAAALERRHRDAVRTVDPEVAHCWRRLTATGGRVRVGRLAAEVGWSRTRLWSRFGAQVGITPKRAGQLIRFDRAVHRLAAGHPAASAAIDCGYVDQSHLHRDVASFAGATPTEVAASPFLALDHVAWPTRYR
jgi:AraC-like DNA-binding protein